MHEIIETLLVLRDVPRDAELEALVRFLAIVGEMLDHKKAQSWTKQYFDRLCGLSKSKELSAGIRFEIEDLLELRAQATVGPNER